MFDMSSIQLGKEGGGEVLAHFAPLEYYNILASILSFYMLNCSNIFQHILFTNRIQIFWSRDILNYNKC